MKKKIALSLGTANGYDVLNEINIIKRMVSLDNFSTIFANFRFLESSAHREAT